MVSFTDKPLDWLPPKVYTEMSPRRTELPDSKRMAMGSRAELDVFVEEDPHERVLRHARGVFHQGPGHRDTTGLSRPKDLT